MLESRRRPSRARTISIILALVIVSVIIWQFAAFQDALNRMPRGWTVAGAPAAGQTPPEVIQRLRITLDQTITLRYRSEIIFLSPHDIGFGLDEPATIQALSDAKTEVSTGAQGFLHYLTQRVPPPRNIPAVTGHSEEELRAFLTQVSERYDQAPTSAAPLVEELRFVAGQPGSELDISASVPLIATAIQSATQRDVNLVVKTVPPVPPTLKLLRDLVDVHLKRNFNGQAGVFVKDLQTGEEIGVNEGVAFSGLGLLKLPILTETFRRLSGTPDEATLELAAQTATGESNNTAANELLQRLGDNDPYAGADRLNSSMRYLGLVNTFIATPYDQDVKPPAIVTRANSRPDMYTSPDARMQTTPEDVGLLLEMIYACSRGGGALMAAYPNTFTPDECSRLLNWLSQATLTDPNGGAPMYIRAGVPGGTRVANKWGWDKETRTNAAVVFTPGGDFVLVIFLRQTNWGDWQAANPVMADVTRAAYNYFALPR